jgi:hypothetical protein
MRALANSASELARFGYGGANYRCESGIPRAVDDQIARSCWKSETWANKWRPCNWTNRGSQIISRKSRIKGIQERAPPVKAEQFFTTTRVL